jgi:hypothetical protein
VRRQHELELQLLQVQQQQDILRQQNDIVGAAAGAGTAIVGAGASTTAAAAPVDPFDAAIAAVRRLQLEEEEYEREEVQYGWSAKDLTDLTTRMDETMRADEAMEGSWLAEEELGVVPAAGLSELRGTYNQRQDCYKDHAAEMQIQDVLKAPPEVQEEACRSLQKKLELTQGMRGRLHVMGVACSTHGPTDVASGGGSMRSNMDDVVGHLVPSGARTPGPVTKEFLSAVQIELKGREMVADQQVRMAGAPHHKQSHHGCSLHENQQHDQQLLKCYAKMRRQREGLGASVDGNTSSSGTSYSLGSENPRGHQKQNQQSQQSQQQDQQQRHCYHQHDTKWAKMKMDYARAKENNGFWREAEKERVRRARQHEHTTRERQKAKYHEAGRRRPCGSKRSSARPPPALGKYR